MSIIKGDTTKLLGEHLPTPYIDRITVKGVDSTSQLDVTVSIHMPVDDTKVFATSSDAVLDTYEAYGRHMASLKYYVVVSIPNATAKPYWEATYEEVVKGNPDANLLAISAGAFEFVKFYVTDYGAWAPAGSDIHSPMLLFQVDFTGATPVKVYSEDGDEIWKYTITQEIPLKDPYNTGTDTAWIFHDESRSSWDAVSNMYVYTFSSTIDYDQSISDRSMYEKYIAPSNWEDSSVIESMVDSFSVIMDHNNEEYGATTVGTVAVRPLLAMKTSAVAYERVFEDGYIADKENVEYFDSKNSPYSQTPLVSIDSAIYKVDKVTHAQIVDKIQGVLDRYKTEYEAERGFDKLKNMYNGISTIITTHANDPYLLPRLATFQRSWPHKTPARAVGKLYKDFRKNIFTINKTIKRAARVYPRIKYSAKVVDLRPLPAESAYTPLYKSDWESNITDYIYNSKFMGAKMNVYYDATSEARKDVVYGMAFFDYEKALMYTSDISRALNLKKLEDWGMPITYSQFYSTQARFIRQSDSVDEDVRIASYIAGEVPDNSTAGTLDVNEYPYTKWVRIYDGSSSKRVRRRIEYGEDDEYANALIGTPYYPAGEYGASGTEEYEYAHSETMSYIPGDGTYSGWDDFQEAVEAAHGDNYVDGYAFEQLGESSYTTSKPSGWPDDYDDGAMWIWTNFDPSASSLDDSYITVYIKTTSTGTSTTYGDTYDAGIEKGYLTSTTLRPFVNVGEPLSSTIDNYRLMCFDLLDYQKNSYATEYAFKIWIKDQTSEVLVELINTFTEAYDALVEYTALCVEQCSFNSDTGQFNDFFRENIVAYYEDDIENAPWIRVPFIFCLHRDLHYDTFGGDLEKIKKAAMMMSQQIDPAQGTLEGVETVTEAMKTLAETIYLEGGSIYEILDDLGAIDSDGVVAAVTTTKIFEADYDIPEPYDTVEVDSEVVTEAGDESTDSGSPEAATGGAASASPETHGGGTSGKTDAADFEFGDHKAAAGAAAGTPSPSAKTPGGASAAVSGDIDTGGISKTTF